ncbi:MAG: O-antigen ligase family protein [Dehalococcoidia bacterium]
MILFLVGLAFMAPVLILFVDPTHDYLPVMQDMRDFVVITRLAATVAFTGGALLCGAVLLALDRWPAARWPRLLVVTTLAFVAVNVLALIFAEDWRTSFWGVFQRYQGFATTLVYVLLFIVAAFAVRSMRDLRLLLWAVFAGAMVAVVYALAQKAGWEWIEWSGRSISRPFSTMGQANNFGAYLVAVVPVAAFLALTLRQRWQLAAIGVAIAAMLAALLFTVSRSAYIGLAAVLLIWGFAAARWFLPSLVPDEQRRRGLQVGVIAAAAAPLVLAFVVVFFVGLPQGRVAVLSETNDEAISGRRTLWVMAAEMTFDRPLLGYGQDAFATKFSDYRDRPDLSGIGFRSVNPESAHNFFLDLSSGTGILGLLSFLALVGAVLWLAARRADSTENVTLRLAIVGLGSAVIGYLVTISFGFAEAMTTWLFWLLLGALAGLLLERPAGTEDGNPSRASAFDSSDEPLTRRQRREQARRTDKQARRAAEMQSSLLVTGVAAVSLSLVGAALLAWAAMITAADLAAGQADAAAERQEFDPAVDLASRAVSLNPFSRLYLYDEAQYRQRSGASDAAGEAKLEGAIATYEDLIDRFTPEANDYLGLATAHLMRAEVTETPVEQVAPTVKTLLEHALDAEPFNGEVWLAIANTYQFQLNDLQRAYEIRVEAYCWGVDCENAEPPEDGLLPPETPSPTPSPSAVP